MKGRGNCSRSCKHCELLSQELAGFGCLMTSSEHTRDVCFAWRCCLRYWIATDKSQSLGGVSQTAFAVSAIPREAFSSPNARLEDCKSVSWGGSSQPQEMQVFITVGVVVTLYFGF